ncbi:hemin-degrading factor [Pseudochrobactrum sp. HB0163]|uniref:hemin-degrading factor n=1 Tax=Pseudochrobactrum sp. HB0163 TaxID=3450708 RepID=UPI003F6E1BE1
MIAQHTLSPHDILRLRREDPNSRERDFAKANGITEADLVAAHVGICATRLNVDIAAILNGAATLGEVMALTRNESVVHEKIGPYEKVSVGAHASLVLGRQIDLRIFPKAWAYGFAVEKAGSEGNIRRSLQFFNHQGDAVHKIHLREKSDLAAYQTLVARLRCEEQSRTVALSPAKAKEVQKDIAAIDIDGLRERWTNMTDVHQFVTILRDYAVTRKQAVELAGAQFAWELQAGSVEMMMNTAAVSGQPIMVFAGNNGCIQIHTGPVKEIKMMGPWLNIMDPAFHMHLRTDHIHTVWVVRKPTKDGHVTSLEAYDVQGEMIVQFFGARQEGEAERTDWRELVESLPRLSNSAAA